MKIRTILVIGLLLITELLHAQSDFRPGYVIDNSGDTLFGQIDYRGSILMSKVCTFKSIDSIIYEYSPNDIAAYRFIDSKYFVSRVANYEQVFLEFLIKGEVNIYYLYDKQGNHYYIDKDDLGLRELYYEESIKLVDDKEYLYKSKSHIGLLKLYMQDAPKLKSRIYSINKPEHNNLVKLAEDYHDAVCDGEKCIIYEKKIPFVKMSIEPIVGLISFFGDERILFNSGVYLYFCSQRSNENIFLKTGLEYHGFQEGYWQIGICKIPIQCQYIYQAGRIQPKISGGLNIHVGKPGDELFLTPILSLNAGLDYKISEIINLSTSLNADFFSYSCMIGLRIDL